MSIVIAVDGTAASGKGTLARKLAAHYGFAHLDSGALYRLTALAVLASGGDPANEADALKGARSIDLSMMGDPAIRTDVVGQAASKVAAIGAVRAALLDFQRDFLAHPPGGSLGAVMDGRDIGTVIAPGATAKLYVDARPELRAHRRRLELCAMGIDREEADLLRELLARDAADKARPISPLKQAPDAALLDTSDLGIEPAFAEALRLVDPKVRPLLGGGSKDRHRG
ncbi:MAG TPA: (d)CMP kinase [Rhizomicrobium sp.]|jgi:cytidylate kinase|nr:(d)CMP kinase [Rhizomicrobium sp.]